MANETPPPYIPKPLDKPMGRRDFVKTSVKVAAGGAILAGAVPNVVPISYNPRKLHRFPYVGVRILPPGPAPQGIPLIPVTVNKNGELEGVSAKKKIGPYDYSLDWYKYCSHEGAPGLSEDFTADNVLRYFINEEKIAKAKGQGIDLWFKDMLGEPVRLEHLNEVGKGAPFRWRSEGQIGTSVITGIIVKVPKDKVRENKPGVIDGFFHTNDDGTAIMAVCSFCAHFCCVPGYAENNSAFTKFGEGDNHEVIYCTCHDSRYNPYELRQYTFPPDF